MDVAYFLRSRIAFIRQFYDAASVPFAESKRKIEAGEPPFVPPNSEDEEPPFLDEWTDADDSLCILGYACVSMLATAFHLLLKEWETQLGVPVDDSLRPLFKKEGWLKGYAAHFNRVAGIHFGEAPAELSLLEEIVLARNRIQHPESITRQRTVYSSSDMSKLRRAFFVDERDLALIDEFEQSGPSWLFPPTLKVTSEKLTGAITEVETFAAWFDEQVTAHWAGRYRG